MGGYSQGAGGVMIIRIQTYEREREKLKLNELEFSAREFYLNIALYCWNCGKHCVYEATIFEMLIFFPD